MTNFSFLDKDGLITYHSNLKSYLGSTYLPLAGGTVTGDLTVRGDLTASTTLTVAGTLNTATILPRTTARYSIGSSSYKYLNVYATNFKGTADIAISLANNPALNISGDKISVTAGGKTSAAITVPYASNAGELNGHEDSYFATASDVNTIKGWKINGASITSSTALGGTNLRWDGTGAVGTGQKTIEDKFNEISSNITSLTSAFVFKGVLTPSGGVIAIPSSAKVGDTYRAGGTGTFDGEKVEVGDLILCITAGTSATAEWSIIQNNIDGAVTGPTSATSGALASFNGATGKVIQRCATKGDATTPIYINGSGVPTACTPYASATVNAANNLVSAPSLNISGDKISVTAGGKTSTAITVPYATEAGTATTATTATNLASAPSLNISGDKISVTAGGKTSTAITVPYATEAGTANISNISYGVPFYTAPGGSTAAQTLTNVSGSLPSTLSRGQRIAVRFTNSFSGSSMTLAISGVNNGTAISVLVKNITSIPSNSIKAGSVLQFVYDQSTSTSYYYWRLVEAADTNTDSNVYQVATTSTSQNYEYPILMKYTTATSTTTGYVRFASGVTLNPTEKTLTGLESLPGIASQIGSSAGSDSFTAFTKIVQTDGLLSATGSETVTLTRVSDTEIEALFG